MNLSKKWPKFIIITLIVATPIALLVLYSYRTHIKTKLITANNKVEEIKEVVIPPKPTIIKENGLPNKYLINTAFIPQAPEKDWSQPWQDACEEAALLTVDYFYKSENPEITEIKSSILNMIDFEKQKGWSHDINIEQMSLVASEYMNYEAKIIEEPTINQIQEYVSQGVPVIFTGNGKTLYKENKNFSSGGPYYHSSAIIGYDDTKQQFIVHDVGTQFGAYFKYSYDLLLESIHDFPSSGHKEDINTGDKRVLILLK